MLPARLVEECGDDLAIALGRDGRYVAVGKSVESDVVGAHAVVAAEFEPEIDLVSLLSSVETLQWVHALGAGIDHFVTPDLTERGVVVTNAGDAYAPAMSEYVIGSLLTVLAGTPLLAETRLTTREGHPKNARQVRRSRRGELAGKTVGIIGYGHVGRRVAQAVSAFGTEVWILTRTARRPEDLGVDRVLAPHEAADMFASCDAVVVAASLNASSRGLIDASILKRAKDGAWLINVARGDIVDHEALLEAVRQGSLAGAVLDVTSPEPLPDDHPLRGCANVYMTPHIAAHTLEARARVLDDLLWNMTRFVSGDLKNMRHQVIVARHL